MAANHERSPSPAKRKNGAPFGNKNCAGHRNAAGHHHGPPLRNKNAEIDGAQSAVYLDALSDEEQTVADNVPRDPRQTLLQEMTILKIREHRILSRLDEYERASGDALFLTTTVDTKSDRGDSTVRNNDSAFVRVMKLQDVLHRVQNRIVRVATALRAFDEADAKLELERQRLALTRLRVAGEIEIKDDADYDYECVDLEDVDGLPET